MNDRRAPDDLDGDSFDSLLVRAARLSPLSAHLSALRLHPGMTLCRGRFQVQSRLGAGGMGVVYEAFDRQRDAQVAIKTLSQLDAQGIYRLKNEFRALTDIVHPNVVRLHDLLVEDGLWLFSMERVRGQPFDAWTRPNGRVDLGRLYPSLTQLVAGVRAIHAAGKLHRDLKPSNVLAADGGSRVVILDFGLVAEPEPGGRGQTCDTDITGTPHYMAPEQAAGEAPTPASDFYSVGVMLFEALTGRLPFDGRLLAILQKKQVEDAPRASALAPDAPAELDALCAQLLSRDPAARPDGAALAAALAQLAPHEASAPPEVSQRATLLGREDELEQLREGYRKARAGLPVLVSIRGESGIGKTTLASAFVDELRESGLCLVLEGRCYERENVPYKAWDRVVDDITRYLRQQRDTEAALLLPRDAEALARVFPVLSRVDAVTKCAPRPAADATELRRRAWNGFCELLGRLRDRLPLVVFIDDLHWLDHDSALLFERLLADPELAPILFVLGERAEGTVAPLLARVHEAAARNPRIEAAHVHLGRLAPEATRSLAQALLEATDAGPAPAEETPGTARSAWVEAIARESDGSPFFVTELARAVSSRPASGATTVLLEDTVRERARRLGEDASHLLQVLAVAGRPTPAQVMVAAAAPCGDPHRALDVLCGAHLAREVPSRLYECYHDRIRAAVSGGMQAAERRDTHRRLAQAWSQHEDADPEVLFSHLLAAGESEHAGEQAVLAAERATRSLAFEQAAAFLDHAITLLPASRGAAHELHARRAEALSLAGLWAEAGHAFAAASARETEPERRSDLALRAATHFLGSGNGEAGLPLLRALLLHHGVRWPRNRFTALAAATLRFAWLWLRAEGKHSGGSSARRSAARIEPDIRPLLRWLLGAGFVPAYDFARGMYFMSVFAGRGLRSGNDSFLALSLAMLGALFCTSRYTKQKALRLIERATTLCAESGEEVVSDKPHAADYAAMRSATLSFVAYAAWADGRPKQALELGAEAEQALALHGRAHAYTAWVARTTQAYALFSMGRFDEAARIFDDNVRIARETGDDMAVVGGASALRFLVVDDLAAAEDLLDRKERLLRGTPTHGLLRALLRSERTFCALYQGRGADVMADARARREWLDLFDPGVLTACAALQADPRGHSPATRRRLRRALAGLRAVGDTAPNRATALQLRASLALMEEDVSAALAALEEAQASYLSADMAVHAALVRLRACQLRAASSPDPATRAAAAAQADEVERTLRASGIARPDAWANMLVPGLSRPA